MRIVWQEVRDLDRSSNDGRSEVAFVDTSIDGWNRLIEGIPAGIAVVLLDGTEDGLARMAEWAIGRSGYDAIHVLSHGQPGALKLGTLTLDADMLADRSGDLADVGSMLRPGGDLLLYACNLASGCGEDFLSALSAHVGANVAASLTPTGAVDLGGDWDLNWIHGAVATNALRLDAFRGVLMAAPVLVSMVGYIDENTITLTFDAPLDAANIPALTAFGSVLQPSSLEVNSTQRTITSAVISGSNIILTFSGGAFSAADTVQIRYSDLNPGADDVSGMLQGTGGEDVATFTEDYTVNSVRPPSVPILQSAEVNGSSLVLTYDIALDAGNGPVPDDFAVEVNGTPVTVSSVVVNSANKTVTLTLAEPVEVGDAVTVSYTDPGGGDDVAAVQSVAGDDAESFSGETVTNNTPDTTAPAAPAITSPAITKDTTPVISGTAEAGATITLTIGGATYTTVATGGVWSINLGTATPVSGWLSLDTSGNNSVSVTATDAASNESELGTQNLTIDTTVPSAPAITSAAATKDTTPVISGTAEAGATVTLTIGGGDLYNGGDRWCVEH